jgi:RNA-splicing ligase RtcB
VRLVASKLTRQQIAPRMRELVNQLFRDVPTGVGAAGALSVQVQELRLVAEQGARWAVEHGFGSESDLDHIEESGCRSCAGFATGMGSRTRATWHAWFGQSFSGGGLCSRNL